jgi:hypothetical protein
MFTEPRIVWPPCSWIYRIVWRSKFIKFRVGFRAHPWSAAAGRGGGAVVVWGLGEARTVPRQVPADPEIGQKRLRCRSEKRSRETPVTLPAAVKTRASSLSNPLAALAGWIGQLAPRAVGTRRTA